MKKLHKYCLNLVLGLAGVLFSLHGMATCTTTNSYSAYATLRGVNYSAGADFPVSGLIFKQVFSGVSNVSYSCTEGSANFVLSVSGGPPWQE